MNLIYKIRRPLDGSKKRFVAQASPHLFVLGAFGWRVLIHRNGPNWWKLMNMPDLLRITIRAKFRSVL